MHLCAAAAATWMLFLVLPPDLISAYVSCASSSGSHCTLGPRALLLLFIRGVTQKSSISGGDAGGGEMTVSRDCEHCSLEGGVT